MVQKLVPYSIAASATLLTYDVLSTLRYEIEHVWLQPFSLGSLLFYLNRYLPFVDTFISLNVLSDPSPKTPEQCLVRFKVVTWFIVLGTLIAELTLMIRTYAIWQRSRAILIALSLVFIIVAVPSIVVTQIEVDSLVYGPTSNGACRLVKASPIIFVAYVLLMLSETIIAGLTFYKAITHLRRTTPDWIRRMYKEGMLFYLYLTLLSITNVLVPLLGPTSLANWLATPQRVIHSILCTRVLLSILVSRTRHARRRRRQQGSSSGEGTGLTVESDVSSTPLEFATRSVVLSTDWDAYDRQSEDDEWEMDRAFELEQVRTNV